MAEIKMARVDFRLIHGQIVVSWCKAFGVNKIVIIDNVVAGDEFMLSVYASAVPAGVVVKAYDEEKALRLWYKNRFGNDKKVLVLFKDPDTCYRVIKAGLDLKQVQLGGVPQMNDRKMVKRAVFLGEKEIAHYVQLNIMRCLRSDGTVVAVGDNGRGQCDFSKWEGEKIVAIAAGGFYTVGLTEDGRVVTTQESQYILNDISKWEEDGYKMVAIAAGYGTTFAIDTEGNVHSTGHEDQHQRDTSDWDKLEIHEKEWESIRPGVQ